MKLDRYALLFTLCLYTTQIVGSQKQQVTAQKESSGDTVPVVVTITDKNDAQIAKATFKKRY